MLKFKRFFQIIFRHKYISTIVFFVALIAYLDSNSLYNLIMLKREANELQAMIDSDSVKTAAAMQTYRDLQAHPHEATIRIAREEFYMHKPNEDVYVFEDEE